jgi:hypothetical protein
MNAEQININQPLLLRGFVKVNHPVLAYPELDLLFGQEGKQQNI